MFNMRKSLYSSKTIPLINLLLLFNERNERDIAMVHWQLEWRTPINMKYVIFAKKILRTYFNDKSNETTIDRAIPHDDNYLLKNIVTLNATENAIFYTDDSMVKVGYSYYPIIFSVPRSNIIHDDTKELDIPIDVIIKEWAYKNCYIKSINHILEDWGKMIYGLLSCGDNEPMLKYGAYKNIIQKIMIRRGLEKYNENNRRKKEPKMESIPKSDDSENLMLFYTDGAGNLYGKKKRSATGHYSVLLDNTNEKWKHKEAEITSNIAEIKGVLAAVMISVKRGYENVEIMTDSQPVIKWLNGMDIHIITNIKEIWRARDKNIRYYIEKLISYGKKIPHLKVTWIKRLKNKAHAI